MNIKGLSIKNIINMSAEDINKLNTKDLRQLVGRLVSASNKRVKRLEKSELGLLSPAYQSVKRRGRLFSTKNKQINQLRNEFKVAKNFLNMKTSTAKGFKELRKETVTRLGKEFDSIEQEKRFWQTYRKIEESGNILPNDKGGSAKVQEILANKLNENPDANIDDLIDDIDDDITKAYEEYFEDTEEDEDEFFTNE